MSRRGFWSATGLAPAHRLACRMRVEFGKARCRLHGGLSTGPKTEAGRTRIAEAQRRRWRHYRERRLGTSLAEASIVMKELPLWQRHGASSHCRPQGSEPVRTMLWNDRNYSRNLRPRKWGSRVRLHGNNLEPRMSVGSKADMTRENGSNCLRRLHPRRQG
jgi:hypothetical protein